MIPYSLVFAIVFVLFLSGAAYMLLRKAPLLVAIPEESIANRETFFSFCIRITRSLMRVLSLHRMKMYVLAHTARTLSIFREFSLKIHRVMDTMAHSAKKKSQEMEREHQRSSEKEEKEQKEKDEHDDSVVHE